MQNGILYRQQESVLQLVVPQAAREAILVLGHSVPWAGHLGKHKTTARIKKHFHWPGLHRDVAEFCKSCPQCQMTSASLPSRAPLLPLPIIATPFECLGMDIVGPVEKSKAGNRYMLVITDYATKYPEVFPLKSIKAKSVAFCLVQFFSRVGFPREILTDQGTNFVNFVEAGLSITWHQEPENHTLPPPNGWADRTFQQDTEADAAKVCEQQWYRLGSLAAISFICIQGSTPSLHWVFSL